MCIDCGVPTATDEEINNRVNAGIEWLNDNGPDNWRELINLDTLNVDEPDLCILGQVFADKANNPAFTRKDSYYGYEHGYSNGYDYAVYTFFDGEFDTNVTGPLGFSGYAGDSNAYAVTAEWKRVLSA